MKTKYEGKIISSNLNGDFVVLSYAGKMRYHIRFIDTGFETTVRTSRMIDGCVKDKLRPSVRGVGYVGDGAFSSKSHQKAYVKWVDMINRVYNPAGYKCKLSYANCSICDEWLNFQNFARWFYENYPDDGLNYELDKDLLSTGNSIYSPSTCSFLTGSVNKQISNSREHYLLSPSGELMIVFNLADFCRVNDIKSTPGWVSENSKFKRKRANWNRVSEVQYRQLLEEQNK